MQDFGIYVHIPFCKKKCKYCDFISFECVEEYEERYINALINEIEDCKLNKRVSTIYFGGGTPSIISEKNIEKVLKILYEKFEIDKDAEITLEVNPGTVNMKKLQKYKEIGINRLSIGLQSTDDSSLKMLGRIHTYSEFLETFENAKTVGFDNINVDLILGIPNQTIDKLNVDLQNIVKLNPKHISVYSLILEDGTELEKEIANNKLEMISDLLERQMYWKTKKYLKKNGYEQYEISNFAQKGYESRHNMSCWNQDEYIGFGLASHSYIDKTRYSNITNLEEYIKNVEEKNFNKNVIIEEKQNVEIQAKEYMMLNLRKIEGVSISKFEQKFQINPLFYFRFEIQKLTDENLIEVDLDNIKLTNKGLDFANLVFEEFV